MAPIFDLFLVARPDLVRPWAEAVILVAYLAAQILLAGYSSHRYLVLWRWWRGTAPAGASEARPAPREWPLVTVQLPVYNEREVIERLVDAVAALDYPPNRLEIQVLDDSTDDTRVRAASAVARHRVRGVRIRHMHRARRRGYKAGALADGLACAEGELIAIFDADFLPRADFLRRMVPRFADPGLGMVQARWGHLNRERSLLTAAQAAMLDAHFMLEHRARAAARLFFNFNGTAGVWRRTCIEDAGGWSSDTLTEDLDLSYRAQLRGWRFGYAHDVETPAELPADMEAFKSQQRRWVKGSIQTARKILPSLLASPLPRRVKLEAFIHLTSNAAYPLLLVLTLLLLPVLVTPAAAAPWLVWFVQIGVLLFGMLPVAAFLTAGRRSAGGSTRAVLRDVPAVLVLGIGMSVNNSRAVLEGLAGRVGEWERTPKTGDRDQPHPALVGYSSASRIAGRSELLLAAYFAALGAYAWTGGYHRAVPFLALLLAGFGYVGLGSLRASRHPARALRGGRRLRAA